MITFAGKSRSTLRTFKYIIAFIVVIGFVGYVCYDIFFPNGFGADANDETDNVRKTALNIGIPNNIASLPVWIAEEEGIFDSLKVDISVKNYTDQLDCDMAFADGKINMEITDPKRADWLKAERNQSFVELYKLPMPYAMMASHNARISNLTQMKDKMLAVTRHSSYSESAFHCLDSIKMNRDSVYIVQINNPAVASLMLHNGELDATFLPEPFISIAKTMGHNVLYYNYTQALLISKTDVAEADTKLFKKAMGEALKRIRKKGLSSYSELIARRCKCSKQFEKELKIRF